MRTGSIYLIINKENGHKYISKTTEALNKEWKYHIERAKRMSKEPLHSAMRKHGNHNFSIKQIDECNETELDKKIEYWVGRYNPEYNNSSMLIEGACAYPEGEKPTTTTFVIKKKEEKKRTYGFQDPKNRGGGGINRIQVLGINIETGEEKTWESASSAAEEVAGNSKYGHNILKCADKGWKVYGHRWRRIDNKTIKRKIYGVHKVTWEETPIYDSIRDAVRKHVGNTTSTGISKSLKNPHKYTWKGYYWFYVQP